MGTKKRRNKNIRLADSYDQGCSTLRNNPLIWLDHAGLGYNEGHDDVPDSHESYHNEHEAKLGELNKNSKIYRFSRSNV
jgi:hypothetical protein